MGMDYEQINRKAHDFSHRMNGVFFRNVIGKYIKDQEGK
jgi:hypothetical protein